MKLLLDDGDEYVSRDGAPDLRLDRVLAVAHEMLDAQMLLDPFEQGGAILPVNISRMTS